MNTKDYLTVTMLVFAVVALVQLTRIVQGWAVIIGGDFIPMWASYVTVAVAGGLAGWAFVLRSKLAR